MKQFEVTLIALDLRKWDLETQRISLTIYLVLDDEERTQMFDLSITQPPEMVEEFLGKVRVGCEQKLKNKNEEEEGIQLVFPNETFLRQKLYNYFKRILMELNNPKRKKGQAKMIFTTHMDVYNENQDISFLPQILQFYVVLNWARKYYDKEDYQRAVEPLRKLIKIKPDFGLGYKWLARSLKKIRKYDEATRFYEKYAEVDDSLDAWLDLAKSYRKGKIFDKSEKIYHDLLKKYPGEKEARIGLAQIQYARNNSSFIEMLDELYEEDPGWLKKWLVEEFNFRIYVSPKTPLTPVQASQYLGYDKVFELTQRAFRNEIPSHFNPSRARISFFKEELDNWAMVMNRYHCFPEEVKLYPDRLPGESLKPVEVNLEEGESGEVVDQQSEAKGKYSTRVEDILRKIRASKAQRTSVEKNFAMPKRPSDQMRSAVDAATGEVVKKRRGRPPKKKEAVEVQTGGGEVSAAPDAVPETPKKRRGRPPKKKEEIPAVSQATTEEAPKKRRGRPPKKKTESTETGATDSQNKKKKKKRGRPRKNVDSGDNGNEGLPETLDLPSEKEFLLESTEED